MTCEIILVISIENQNPFLANKLEQWKSLSIYDNDFRTMSFTYLLFAPYFQQNIHWLLWYFYLIAHWYNDEIMWQTFLYFCAMKSLLNKKDHSCKAMSFSSVPSLNKWQNVHISGNVGIVMCSFLGHVFRTSIVLGSCYKKNYKDMAHAKQIIL